MSFLSRSSLLAGVLAVFATQNALGAGFEKSVIWSGKHVGRGGAAASSVTGSQSLYYNPAGLASPETFDANLSYSPIWAQSKGPLVKDDQSVTSKRVMRNSGGVMAKYTVTPNLGIGLGYYAVGGSGADFGETDMTATGVTAATAYKPLYKSEVSLSELGLGVAYRLIPGLSLGVTWRASFVSAEFQNPGMTKLNATTYMVTGANLHGLSATNWAGFRFGVQYAPEGGDYGVGLVVRTPIDFTAKGKVSGKWNIAGSTTVNEITDTDASVKSSLPFQLGLGGHYSFGRLSLFGQYELSTYSKNAKLDFDGGLTFPAPVSATVPLTDIALNWRDQHAFRLGVEFAAMDNLAVRAGYVRTTQVTSSTDALPTLFSPGPANSFILGAGYGFLDNKLTLDLALDYGKMSGTVTTPSAGSSTKKGSYEATGFAVHSSLTYRM